MLQKTMNKVAKHAMDIPEVVCVGIAWEKDTVSSSEISSFTKLLKTKNVELKNMFRAVSKDLKADLVGVIGYYGKHYVTLTNVKKTGWLLINDTTIKKVPDICELIKSWKLQPNLLFYEITNADSLTPRLTPKNEFSINSLVAVQKRQILRESLRLDSPSTQLFEEFATRIDLEPHVSSTLQYSESQVISSYVQVDLNMPSNDNQIVERTTDRFGVIVEGNNPITTCVWRKLSPDNEYYYCNVHVNRPPNNEDTAIQYRNLKLCVFLNGELIMRDNDIVLVSIKFRGQKAVEFVELSKSRKSSFLDIPYVMHQNEDFELQFRRRWKTEDHRSTDNLLTLDGVGLLG